MDDKILNWLLEPENQPVRYLTLINLFDKPNNNPDVKATKTEVITKSPISKILQQQSPLGNWDVPEDFYVRSKYKGTVWTLLLLAEMGADHTFPELKKGCEFMLQYSQDRESGGFAYTGSKTTGGKHENIIPCLTGNMIWVCLLAGMENDPRVQMGINWLVKYLRFDDGDTAAPNAWPYMKFPNCYGKHACLSGVIKGLKALAMIEANKRTSEMTTTINNAVEFILKHQIYKSSHNPDQLGLARLTELNFPLMWDSDIIEVLEILNKLGIKDNRMLPALQMVKDKQQIDGTWLLERTYANRYRIKLESKGKSSKWITLRALILLKKMGF